MKTTLIITLNLIFFFTSYSQTVTVENLLNAVRQAQAKVQRANYTVLRADTLVTDDTRTMAGGVIMEREGEDSIFGFRFKGKLDSGKQETIYDGHVGYEANTRQKTYLLFTTPADIKYLLYRSGGWLVIPELLNIDTSGVKSIQFTEDMQHYYLTFYYPDLTEYDVEKRRKIVGIDKQTFLPVSVRSHQETLGKTQDLYWRIINIQVNQPLGYDFAVLPFLNDYVQLKPAGLNLPILKLKDTQAPAFALESLDGKIVSSASFKGKVILLDFWEVWCGPCIASMPKVQALYDKYKKNGLVVYGIVNDLRNVDATKEFIKKRSIHLPVLMGNEQLRKNYKFDGSVPLYILINKEGKIAVVQYGFNDDIESVIRQELD